MFIRQSPSGSWFVVLELSDEASHYVLVRTACLDDTSLSQVPGADLPELEEIIELWFGSDTAGRRTELFDQLEEHLSGRLTVAPIIDDELGVDPMSSGKPTVLPNRPLARFWRQLASLVLIAKGDHQGLSQRSESHRFAQRRCCIAHTKLNSPEVGMGSDVPPHLTN